MGASLLTPFIEIKNEIIFISFIDFCESLYVERAKLSDIYVIAKGLPSK